MNTIVMKKAPNRFCVKDIFQINKKVNKKAINNNFGWGEVEEPFVGVLLQFSLIEVMHVIGIRDT